MTNKIPQEALDTLAEVLGCAIWLKCDLRSFFEKHLDDASVLDTADWNNTKLQIAEYVLGRLALHHEKHKTELLNMFRGACEFDDFRILANLEKGEKKVRRAKKAVEKLKKVLRRVVA